MLLRPQLRIPRLASFHLIRTISTLPNNPYIYVFPDPSSTASQTYTMSLLPTDPPNPSLALGSTTAIPPTPSSVSENPAFLKILDSVVAKNAVHDPSVISQARAMASPGGATLGSGGAFFPDQSHRSRAKQTPLYGGAGGDSAGGANVQGGMGSGGRGGWIHVSDERNPPDYGRIAWPEDIFGSLEVDGNGEFVGENGNYQGSGTYRLVTREGILGLSPFLRAKLVERLKEIEEKETRD